MPFQTQVNTQPAPAVAGDFASADPRATYIAGPGGLVAGPQGTTVGAFAWVTPPNDIDGTPTQVNSFGSGPVDGFMHRAMQGLITIYLAEASMVIPPGFEIGDLFTMGAFWVVNNGSTEAVLGQKCYANYSNGLASFAAAGAPNTGGSGTASSIAASTGSFTGSITGNIMTLTAIGSGTAVPGGTLSGTNVASGTKIVSQLTPLLVGETAGGVGRYYVSIADQAVASTTISETYGTFTAGGTITGSFGIGDVLSGAGGGGVTAGTLITALGTGTGGAGTYIVTPTQTVTSTTISATSNVETKWYARSSGPAGSLIKISSHPVG